MGLPDVLRRVAKQLYYKHKLIGTAAVAPIIADDRRPAAIEMSGPKPRPFVDCVRGSQPTSLEPPPETCVRDPPTSGAYSQTVSNDRPPWTALTSRRNPRASQDLPWHPSCSNGRHAANAPVNVEWHSDWRLSRRADPHRRAGEHPATPDGSGPVLRNASRRMGGHGRTAGRDWSHPHRRDGSG